MTEIVSQPIKCTDRNGLQLERFDISSALAAPFRGLTDAVESNLHKASRSGDCEKVFDKGYQKRIQGGSKESGPLPA